VHSWRNAVIASLALITCSAICSAQEQERELDDFVVSDIKVEGLQRISEGTVYNYLPVNIGDHLSPARIREAIRALYGTGFFRDVELRRDGNTLIVAVLERPAIENFEVKGNKDIKTEDLTKSLRNVGLAAGKTFDRSVLEDVKQYLTDQYYSRGKYGVKIETNVEELAGNRVKIKINITEGKRAKIRQINLVGNTRFPDKNVLAGLDLHTPNWLSWYKQDDRYSREQLQGDLEKLRSYYMDRGYANFQIESTQVAIAPEKDDIFITVNLDSGDVYKVADVKLAGTFVVPEAELKNYLLVKPGQIYSRKDITATQELIQNRLGVDGYAFAKVDPVPTPDEEHKTIGLTFVVDPGNRVYVRHITFANVTKINDVVLRREMRQLEGSALSNVAVERSKQRLQRLPYIEKVESETTPVPGSPDLVDVNFDIKEGPSAQLGGGIGYSESQKFILNGNYADANFFGSGERVALDINAGKYSTVYNVSQTDPYQTIDGISRTLSFNYRDSTQFVSSSSQFSSKTLGLGIDYSYPITEFQGVRLGLSGTHADLLTSVNSASEAVEWVQHNGHPNERLGCSDYTAQSSITGEVSAQDQCYEFYGSEFNTVELVAGYNFDSRNRGLFADRGGRTAISFSYVLPGTDVQFWTGSFQTLEYVPLIGRWTASFTGQVDYGSPLGKTTGMPPYRLFFAGGPDSVRGYTESRLGPKDEFGNPFGGNLKVLGRAEILIPTPDKWKASARVSLFYDIGNVFMTGNGYTFVGRDGLTPVTYHFSYNDLKRSAGIAVQWLAPLGVFRFSLAVPLNAYPGDDIRYPDQKEAFQFSVGQAF